MKKILQITGSLKMGGLETVAVNCMKYADASKFQFDFLVYGEEIGEFEEQVKQYGCKVIHIPSPQKGYIKYCKNIKKILKEYGPYDIVHSHTYFNSAIPIMVAKKMGIPYCIAHAHSVKRASDSDFKKRLVYLFMRRLLNRYTDRFCACSIEAGEWVFGETGFKSKGIVLPNMIDIDKYAFSPEVRKDIRKEFGISQQEFVMGCVGRLAKVKNYYFLLELFTHYQKKYGGMLLIVGDGELQSDLIEYAKKLHVEDAVIFTGARRDVFKILSAIDIFVLPSKHEGLGIVLLEAMANGLHCIVNKDAIVKAIRGLELCVCVDGWDVENWSKEINMIMNQNEKHRKDYTTRMLVEYGIDSFVKKIQVLY